MRCPHFCCWGAWRTCPTPKSSRPSRREIAKRSLRRRWPASASDTLQVARIFMELSRRQLLAGMAVASPAAAQYRPGNGPKPRTTPAVCLYSQLLIKIPYDELGPILRDLGVDGCDLSVQAGGHVK